ncbi:MAG: mechanosensitive ion channel domain-containing protein [Bacteroidota bacterium]
MRTLQIDTSNLLQQMLSQLIEFGDNIIGALLILIVGLIIVRLVARVLRKGLQKTGVDKFADKHLNRIDFLSSNNVRVVPSTLFSKILYYFLLLVVLVAATDVLQMEAVSTLVQSAINYIPYLITAFAIMIVGVFLADFLKNVSSATLASLGIPAAGFIANFIFYFVLLNILMLALEQALINTDFITSNLSIILGGVVLAFAIGYGLASRSIMSNYIAHFYNRNKVALGDVIQIEGKRGRVKDMDNTTLTIASEEDDREIIIPLSRLNNEIIEIIERKPQAPSQPPM